MSSSKSEVRGLFRIGGFSIILTGLFYSVGSLSTNYILNKGISATFDQYLYYVYNNGLLLNLSGLLTVLAVGLLVPSTLALAFALKGKNTGYALIGATLAIAGSFTYFANIGTYFYFLDNAALYTQCTPCVQNAYAEALGAQFYGFAFLFGTLLISVAIGIFGVLMRGSTFRRGASQLGFATSAIGIFTTMGAFVSYGIFANLRAVDTGTRDLVIGILRYAGLAGFILFIAWTIIVGRRLIQLESERSI